MEPEKIYAHWKVVRQGLLRVIESFEETDLNFKATPGGWPAGQIMIHIANAEEGWFQYVVTRELDHWPDHLSFQNYSDKTSIIQELSDVHSKTRSFISKLSEDDVNREIDTPWDDSLSLFWIIWHVIEHEIHHRGELSLMLSMLGKAGLEV
jgi:uncharacterized damage-inducible protein DinB